jgi:oligopeptide transport system ATP-binding protein
MDKAEKQRLIPIPGTPPDLVKPPKGCPFAARCPHTMKICLEEMPAYTRISKTHRAACWLLDKEKSQRGGE